MKLELRNSPAAAIELRSFGQKLAFRKTDKKGMVGIIEGYAALYDVESRDMGGWREILARGAFTESLKKGLDIRMLYQHRSDSVMARESAKTLKVGEDSKGILFEAELIDTTANRDRFLEIESGNLDAMSFGMPYSSVTARWHRDAVKKYDIRTVTKADIVEISVVTWAAYEATTVTARDYENFLKEANKPPTVEATPISLLRSRQEVEGLRHVNGA